MGTAQSKKDTAVGNTKAPSIEQFVTPTGLYPTTNNWDLRVIKKLVLSKKLAPLYQGKEKEKETDFPNHEECPICFLNYPSLNRSLCCKKSICTECYIQIKKPNVPATCPYCNRQNYNIIYTGALTVDERKKDEEEQQKVIELKIKIRQEELERDRQREEEKKKRQSTSPASSMDGEHDPISKSLPTTPSMNVRSSQDSSTPQPKENPTSYPSSPVSSNFQMRSPDVEPETDVDFDDMMLMEAIRLSLLDYQKNEPKPPVKNTRPTSPENNEHRAQNNITTDLLDDSLHATDTRDHSTLNTSEHRVPSERESNSISTVDTRANETIIPIAKSETLSLTSSHSGYESKEEVPNLRSSMSSDQQEQYELELAISLSLQKE